MSSDVRSKLSFWQIWIYMPLYTIYHKEVTSHCPTDGKKEELRIHHLYDMIYLADLFLQFVDTGVKVQGFRLKIITMFSCLFYLSTIHVFLFYLHLFNKAWFKLCSYISWAEFSIKQSSYIFSWNILMFTLQEFEMAQSL